MLAVAAFLAAALSNDELSVLEAKLAKVKDSREQTQKWGVYEEVEAGMLKLVEDDKLTTAAEFRRAANLFAPSNGDIIPVQAQYEMILVAAAEGDAEARTALGSRWDNLLLAMGRGRRIGVVKMEFPYGGEKFELRPTAPVVLAVYKDFSAASARAKGASSNAEVKQIVDADQDARKFDFSKVTTKQIEDMAKGDVARLKRIKEIVASGDLKTSDDFDNAALVFQHGGTFEDYALAHELSVCALLLGKRSASWLAGASYDRMLVNVGIPQRFATQYGNAGGGPIKLQRYETKAINDTERKLIVRVTLEQAKNRKWD